MYCSILIKIYYNDGFRKNIHCLSEEDYSYVMKMYGFDPEKDVHKTIKKGREIEYFIPQTILMGHDEDDKRYRIKEILVDKNYEWLM